MAYLFFDVVVLLLEVGGVEGGVVAVGHGHDVVEGSEEAALSDA